MEFRIQGVFTEDRRIPLTEVVDPDADDSHHTAQCTHSYETFLHRLNATQRRAAIQVKIQTLIRGKWILARDILLIEVPGNNPNTGIRVRLLINSISAEDNTMQLVTLNDQEEKCEESVVFHAKSLGQIIEQAARHFQDDRLMKVKNRPWNVMKVKSVSWCDTEFVQLSVLRSLYVYHIECHEYFPGDPTWSDDRNEREALKPGLNHAFGHASLRIEDEVFDMDVEPAAPEGTVFPITPVNLARDSEARECFADEAEHTDFFSRVDQFTTGLVVVHVPGESEDVDRNPVLPFLAAYEQQKREYHERVAASLGTQ